jgi:ligand-binding sensor domain-containing protein
MLGMLTGCGAQAGAWRLIGPDDGAHVFTMVADPHVAGLVYAGADDGGVYRTLADQSGHVVSGDGIPHDATVASLLPDPQHAGVVFGGTSDGLYRSTHYGDHWSAYGVGLPAHIAVVALAATPNDAIMLAGLDHGGIYRSADDGASWAQAGGGLPAQATPVALVWNASDHLWLLGLVAVTGAPLYASADDGQSWTARATGLPAGAQVNDLALLGGSAADSAAAAPTLIAATTQGLFASADVGGHWSHIGSALPQGSALALATLPQQPGWLYVALGSAVYRSTDAGAQWQSVAPGLTSSVQALAVTQGKQSGPVVFAAVDQVARYPTGIPSGGVAIPEWIPLALILLGLIGGGYLLSRRTRRFGYAMGALRNERNTGRAAEEAERWSRQQRESSGGLGGVSGPAGRASGQQRRLDDAQTGEGRVIAPSDLTSRSTTGAPADGSKAAQNGHGKPKQRD